MLSKTIKMLLTDLLLISIYFSFVVAHSDPAYFRNADDGFATYNNWMKGIGDSTPLSQLALPGTHDSSTFKSGSDIVKTQTISFSEQLNYGIRFFDIRVRHTSDRFALHHGIVFLDVMFGDFLGSVTDFLRQNPSETVLFRLKEEQDPDNNNSRSLGQTLKYYLDTYGSYLLTQSTGVTLREARGKYIVISDNSQFDPYGISYSNFAKQDEYNLKTNWDLYKKWEAVKAQLYTTRNGNLWQFYINYLSGSGGSFPYFVASGHVDPGTSASRLSTGLTTPGWKDSYPDFPRVNCFIGICTIAFEGTNILTRDYLKAYPGRKRNCGVVIGDFFGTDLIKTILSENF